MCAFIMFDYILNLNIYVLFIDKESSLFFRKIDWILIKINIIIYTIYQTIIKKKIIRKKNNRNISN